MVRYYLKRREKAVSGLNGFVIVRPFVGQRCLAWFKVWPFGGVEAIQIGKRPRPAQYLVGNIIS